VDNDDDRDFVDPLPQWAFEFTVAAGAQTGMRYAGHRQALIGYLTSEALEESIPGGKTVNDLVKSFLKADKVPYRIGDDFALEQFDSEDYPRTIYDESTHSIDSVEDHLSIGKGWHRIISMKNTDYAQNILMETLLPTGLLIAHDDGEYSLPELSELQQKIRNKESKVFYIELRNIKGYLKLKRTFDLTKDGTTPTTKQEPEPEPETKTPGRKKVNK
jgi:hypothetical protein